MVPCLVDQGSAQYEDWYGPKRGAPDEPDAWVVYVRINDKDTSGKYSGFKQYEFVLRDDKVIRGACPAGAADDGL